jgi:hypothetical protein
VQSTTTQMNNSPAKGRTMDSERDGFGARKKTRIDSESMEIQPSAMLGGELDYSATVSALAARVVEDSFASSVGSLGPFESAADGAPYAPGPGAALDASIKERRASYDSRPMSREPLARVSFMKGNSQYMSATDSLYSGGDLVGGSLLQTSKSASNLAQPSATTQFSATQPLPPIKLQQMRHKAMKRRMLARAGFDESVGRSTPRCLKGDVETPFQHHATAAGGGGASVHAPPPPQPLTIKEKALVVDEASIAETIEMLRRELDVAKESMTY